MKNNEDFIIDLHTHTCYSDGELTPDELIKHAYDKNVRTLAITDHDTIRGLKNINYDMNILKEIKFIPGIELSAKVDKGVMHILGYGIDMDNERLNKKMNELRDNRMHACLSLMEQIKRDYGILFGYEDIINLINSNHNLGKPDLAKLCVKNGYAKNIQDAFDKYLLSSYEKVRGTNKRLTYQECINLIIESGGIPVLAHPKTLKLTEKELLILVKEMITYGLQGIEVYHSTHTIDESEFYIGMASKYDLLISGGSDYHGKNVKPDIEVGTGKGNLKIKKLSLLNKL